MFDLTLTVIFNIGYPFLKMFLLI